MDDTTPAPSEGTESRSSRPDLSRPSSGYIPDEYYDYNKYVNDLAGRGSNVIHDIDPNEFDAPYGHDNAADHAASDGDHICGCSG